MIDKYTWVMLSVLVGFASAKISDGLLPIRYADLDAIFFGGAIVIMIFAIKMFEKKPNKIRHNSLYK
jgi:hypothetical protein